MAKRKRATRTAATRTKSGAKARTAKSAVKRRARKAAPKRKTVASRRTASARAKKAARKASPKRSAKTRAVEKAKARKSPARSTAAKKRPAKRTAAPAGRRRATQATAPRPTTPRSRTTRVKSAPVRQPIPSSLGLPQSPSAARSGREELREHLQEHTETGPAITAGDLDANWALAYSSGDEAPGGDNPTPGQDVVDDIGHALGIEYGPAEELRGANKVEDRDKHRWELDPASSEDYTDRRRDE